MQHPPPPPPSGLPPNDNLPINSKCVPKCRLSKVGLTFTLNYFRFNWIKHNCQTLSDASAAHLSILYPELSPVVPLRLHLCGLAACSSGVPKPSRGNFRTHWRDVTTTIPVNDVDNVGALLVTIAVTVFTLP